MVKSIDSMRSERVSELPFLQNLKYIHVGIAQNLKYIHVGIVVAEFHLFN